MSQYVVQDRRGTRKWVFGWDQPLRSFFLQVHDTTLPEDDDDRIMVWLGATKDTVMYEVKDLVSEMLNSGLSLHRTYRTALQHDKDEGI